MIVGPPSANPADLLDALKPLRIDADMAANDRDLTLVLTNEGVEPATDITIVDALGFGTSLADEETGSESGGPPEILVNATSDLDCSAEAATVSCGPATLAPGAEATLTVRFGVKDADPLHVDHLVTVSARVPPAV